VNKWILILVFPLLGFTPLSTNHESKQEVDSELSNIYLTGQGKQFLVVNSTPQANEYQEGQFVIFSSGTVLKLMLTLGTTVYEVNISTLGGKK
jgi:hypothetical protein